MAGGNDFFTAPARQGFTVGMRVAYANTALKSERWSFAQGIPKLKQRNRCCHSLLHDVCKVGLYKVDYRNKKMLGNGEKVPTMCMTNSSHTDTVESPSI